MIPRWVGLPLLGAMVIGLVGAFWAGPNLAVAVPAGGVAALAAGAYVGLLMAERVRFARAPVVPPIGDPVVGLREAFRSGSIGRQKLIQMIATLERSLRERELAPVTPEEEQTLLTGSRSAFHAWADRRLSRLERET